MPSPIAAQSASKIARSATGSSWAVAAGGGGSAGRGSPAGKCARNACPRASTLVIGLEISPFAPAAAMRSRCSRMT